LDENKIKNLVKIGGEMKNILESNFRAKVINQLLGELGYDIGDDKEVQMEANVHVGTTLRADYVINTETGPFVLEAKSPDNPITKKEINQATGYASILKCKYSIVYNGNAMAIMKNSELSADTVDYEWKYSPEDADISVFLALSKDNFPDMLEELIADRKKIAKLKEYITNHSGELEKYIINEVSNKTKLDLDFVNSHLKTLVEYNNDESESTGVKESTDKTGESVLIRSYRDFGEGTGLDFIKRHNAWGFLNIRKIPDYLALYDADHHQINKLYKVKSVEQLNSSTYNEFSDHKKEVLEELSSEGKKFIKLGVEIGIQPIPRGNNYKFMGGKFTTYSKLKKAKSGDDL
jgi:hypothetical protein